MQLIDLGWSPFFEHNFEEYRIQSCTPMRITRENRELYVACCEHGEVACEISGRFRFDSGSRADFPTVGDWVAGSLNLDEMKAVIHAVLPRRSVFSRKVPGQITDEQLIAANIDSVFIVTGLDLNFNIRRIERYLAVAWNSGAAPVIVLNKCDLYPDIESKTREVESIAPGVDILAISAAQSINMDLLRAHIPKGKTVAFLGSSGVGKSTMINTLIGTERQKVREVSDTGSRGRHTTTFRELIVLPGGGIVIDTPGMRELQVWGDEEGLKSAFDDIESLASGCRFGDCSHENEPGCAVLEAVHDGSLDPERLESYYKLKKEFAYLADRQAMKPGAFEKAKNKKISKLTKQYFKEHPWS